MRFLTHVVLAWLISLSMAHAQTLASVDFKDQWDKANPLTETTQWVIFSSHREGGQWVKESLNNLKLLNLSEKNILYVSDISGMPSLISRFIAVPKMRDYPFQMALARESELLEVWPKKEDEVAVMHLDKLDVTSVEYLKDQASLEAYLSQLAE